VTLVFAFDRDWTVDVNPHPRHEAVPLEWVCHLAHETEHAVYAIGNQNLTEEAAVPGVVDIVGMHPDDWDEWLGGKRPSGRYEQFPKRRERLSLIEDLHPEADGYVVVDDLDLSDVSGWDHYHAWEFVPAVRRGEVDPSLPWVETVADGGQPTSAGIVPTDAGHLREWLADLAPDTRFRLRYRADGESRTETVVGLRQTDISRRRPSLKPTFSAVSLDRRERLEVRFEHIEQVDALASTGRLTLQDGETPAAAAAELRTLADLSAWSVSPSAVLTVLEWGGEPARVDALAALRSLAAERPGDCKPALPILRSLLLEDTEGASDALGTLADVAAASPADVAPHTDVVVGYLSAEDEPTRTAAARCLSEVAHDDPADVVYAVPALAPLLDDRDATLPHATYALCKVAEAFPEEIRPLTPTLGSLVTSEAVSDGVRLSASAALGRVTGEYPDAALPVVSDLVTLLESENGRLVNNAVGLLGDVALVHTDAVEPHVEAIATLLTVEDDYARTNATAALARVAEDFPESVTPHTSALITALGDDEEMVRENACWALGYLRAESAREALRDVRDDETERVRRRAQWALGRI
jgi:HEAT repeat protein